jgi:hypothetical protein
MVDHRRIRRRKLWNADFWEAGKARKSLDKGEYRENIELLELQS